MVSTFHLKRVFLVHENFLLLFIWFFSLFWLCSHILNELPINSFLGLSYISMSFLYFSLSVILYICFFNFIIQITNLVFSHSNVSVLLIFTIYLKNQCLLPQNLIYVLWLFLFHSSLFLFMNALSPQIFPRRLIQLFILSFICFSHSQLLSHTSWYFSLTKYLIILDWLVIIFNKKHMVGRRGRVYSHLMGVVWLSGGWTLLLVALT